MMTSVVCIIQVQGGVAALGFQQNPAYGSFELDDQLMDDFDAVWPIIATPDVQGGFQRHGPTVR